ncbi:MAG: hypothetical protein EP341_02985 [Sphingomonadales bacterium]|nr:MAG: hypothetical protein EP341_02985 [Sphingomonadales bacterium]
MSSDEIERVARAIYEVAPPLEWIEYENGGGGSGPPIPFDSDESGSFRSQAERQARAALAAMRPTVDAQKLAEIRARHDSVADMADDEWDNRIYTIADDAFSDRAYLLELIGGSHDAD